MKKILFTLIFVMSASLWAEPQWYSGKLTRIWAYGSSGEFLIMVDSSALDSCKHKYLYFRGATWVDHPKKQDATLSMLLSAYHTNSLVRFVIDKPEDGEYCDAMSIDLFKG